MTDTDRYRYKARIAELEYALRQFVIMFNEVGDVYQRFGEVVQKALDAIEEKEKTDGKS